MNREKSTKIGKFLSQKSFKKKLKLKERDRLIEWVKQELKDNDNPCEIGILGDLLALLKTK